MKRGWRLAGKSWATCTLGLKILATLTLSTPMGSSSGVALKTLPTRRLSSLGDRRQEPSGGGNGFFFARRSLAEALAHMDSASIAAAAVTAAVIWYCLYCCGDDDDENSGPWWIVTHPCCGVSYWTNDSGKCYPVE